MRNALIAAGVSGLVTAVFIVVRAKRANSKALDGLTGPLSAR
jgi:hypothetical protein